MNEVYETEPFLEAFDSFEKDEQKWIERMKQQLKVNLVIGKPLGFSWFREKKFGVKRLYYFLNFQTKKAVLVSFSHKKYQQEIIDDFLLNKEEYFDLIR